MRTLISDTSKLIGKEVKISGWVNSVRSHGQLVFADIRDRSGLIQIIGDKKLAVINNEDVIELTGIINSRDAKYFNPKIITGQIELAVTDFKIIAKSRDLPFDIHTADTKVSLPISLDYRPAYLRNQKSQDIFKIQAIITQAFRNYLISQDFTEFHAPTIVPAATEGGSQVFSVDYFDHKAYLAQSPQLYKQIMVSIFERVFTIAHAYRAEPSVTTRHLTEYVSLDIEMGFIDSWQDIIDVADNTMKYIFNHIDTNFHDILERYQITVPKTVAKTPTIKLKEALEVIYQRTGRDVRNELDMDPEGEREICRYALEKFNSDMIFITHFYTKKRAWYSYPDPSSPEETLTFDLIGRGVEWISGGQRMNDYDQLIAKIKAMGADPADFDIYTQAFRYGMPPEGGFAVGLERVTQNLFGLENIRQATLFPRDMERVDVRLSTTDKKDALANTLTTYLNDHGIVYKQLDHQVTKTSEDSAKARGTALEQGAKALVLIADNAPILAVLSSANKLDMTKFKTLFNIADLKMATSQEVEKITGVSVGAVPPFGNLMGLTTYVDQGLLTNQEIAFNAGSLTKSIIMKSSDYVSLVDPKIGQYAQ